MAGCFIVAVMRLGVQDIASPVNHQEPVGEMNAQFVVFAEVL